MTLQKVNPGDHLGRHTTEVHPDNKRIESWVNDVCRNGSHEVCPHLKNDGDEHTCTKISLPEAKRELAGGDCAGREDLKKYEEGVKELIPKRSYNVKNNYFHTDGDH